MPVRMIVRVRSGGEFDCELALTMGDAEDQVRRMLGKADDWIEFGRSWIRVSEIESVTLERPKS